MNEDKVVKCAPFIWNCPALKNSERIIFFNIVSEWITKGTCSLENNFLEKNSGQSSNIIKNFVKMIVDDLGYAEIIVRDDFYGKKWKFLDPIPENLKPIFRESLTKRLLLLPKAFDPDKYALDWLEKHNSGMSFEEICQVFNDEGLRFDGKPFTIEMVEEFFNKYF